MSDPCSEAATGTPTGIEAQATEAWLLEHVEGLARPLRFELVSGGRSNLTYTVRDAVERAVVLRRPPLGELLESAHDMRREHRIITALGPTPVPVPAALAYCRDASVTGAPFYVMDYVVGEIVRDERDAQRVLPEHARVRVAESIVDVLAALHLLDADAIGLGTLGRHEGYVERQLRRWQRQWEAVRTREVPAIDQARELLEAQRPEQQRASIVHGDYRVDNVVLAPDGSVAAVLDWELCTIGDPLADLGVLLLNWLAPGEPSEHMLSGAPTRLPGFPDRELLLARYAERTRLDVSDIAFYVALAYWKLACIAEGIYVRDSARANGDASRRAIARTAAQVPRLAELALDTLRARA